jgi:hypothetical protein
MPTIAGVGAVASERGLDGSWADVSASETVVVVAETGQSSL